MGKIREKLFEESLSGFKAITGKWTTVIGLVILVIIGLIVWGILHMYGLMTAFVLLVIGAIFLWILTTIFNLDLNEHPAFALIPPIFAIIGFISEKLNIWKVPLTVRLPVKGLIFQEDIVVTLTDILLMLIAIVLIVQLIITIREKYS